MVRQMSASMQYDIVQTTFLLSSAAGSANGASGTPDQVKAYLNAALNGGIDPLGKNFPGFFPSTNAMLAGGDWAVVWGPCVYCKDQLSDGSFAATNSMYVAHSRNLA